MSADGLTARTVAGGDGPEQRGPRGARTRPLARPHAPKSWTVVDHAGVPIPEVEQFLVHLVTLGRTPATVLSYSNTLHLFFQWLELRRLTVFEPTLDELADFFLWLQTRSAQAGSGTRASPLADLSPRTLDQRKKLLSVFYRYHAVRNPQSETLGVLCGLGRRWSEQIPTGKPPRQRIYVDSNERIPRPATISDQQVTELIAACLTARDKFLVHLLDQTGLRIGEALGLHHEDLDLRREVVSVVPRDLNTNGVRVKGMKARQVPAPASVFDSYARYMAEDYRDIDSSYVFVHLRKHRGTPQTYASVDRVLRGIRKRSGIHYNPRMARHSYATRLIRAGVSHETVADILGHEDLRTIRRTYIHLEAADHRSALIAAGVLDP